MKRQLEESQEHSAAFEMNRRDIESHCGIAN